MKKKLILGLFIAVICVYLAVKDLHLEDLRKAFGGIQLGYLSLVFFFFFLTHFFRTLRWRRLISPLKTLSFMEVFAINAVGFLAICTFPFRLGEFVRPTLLKKKFGIPFPAGIATVAAERMLDGLTATLVLFLGFYSLPEGKGMIPLIGVHIQYLAFFALCTFFPLLTFLILIVVKKDWTIRVIGRFLTFLPEKWRKKLEVVMDDFIQGLGALPNLWSLSRLLVESLLVWITVALGYHFAVLAFGLELHWGAAFSILGIASIGIMIPGAPGFVGTFHLFVQASLALYGVEKAIGLAYSIVVHAINLAYIILSGLLGISYLSVGMGNLYDEALKETEA